MDNPEFERLKASVAEQLNPAQCLDLSKLLRRLARARLGDIAIERRTQMVLEHRRCSYCGHTDVMKHGRDGNGRQRFRCRSSVTEDGEVLGRGRTFNGLTNTVLAKASGGRPRKAERLGLGRVNAHHQRLKTFVNRQANGVSTRYLPAHLGWKRAIRRPGFSPENLLFDTLIHTYLPNPPDTPEVL